MANKVSNPISPARQAEYKRTYDRLMERARGRKRILGLHERHHVQPRSLGGGNEKSNIVCLTYREHFLAHWLLTKFTEGEERRNMYYALWRILGKAENNKQRIYTSLEYAVGREAQRVSLIGNKHGKGNEGNIRGSEQGYRAWVTRRNNGYTGMSEESKEKLRSKAWGRSKGSKSVLAKPVVDLETNQIFGAASEAAELYGITYVRGIRECCLGNRKICHGRKFAFLDSPEGLAAANAFLRRKRLMGTQLCNL